jgi:PAS domain S-box-containing protein
MQKPERLFETIANYTYDWETWFSAEGQPLWINPAVERMTGYSVQECMALPDYPQPLIHEEDRAALGRHLASAARGSSDNDVEFRIRRKDGSYGWGAVSWQPVLDEGERPMGFRTSVRDITVRKEAEDALRQAMMAAERADRAKSRFLAAASHDLRQPLQAISMFVGALSRQIDEPQCQDIIESVRGSLKATNELLDALLDISRLDAGVIVPQPQSFAVQDLLEQLETNCAGLIAEKGLGLRMPACSEFVWTDPLILGRILQNLLSNAIRYTEHGRILIGCRRRGGRLAIEVWDTGIGISEDHLDVIFEEFSQIGNPERDSTRGLGLGLAIVRRQAELLNIPVSTRSVLGRGSVFRVEVPLATAAPHDAGLPTTPAAGSLDGLLIMAIDDEPTQLEAIRSFLKALRCTVITASSAEEAAAQLAIAGRPADAVIADYRLRDEETGVAAIMRVREATGITSPGILLTGDTEPGRLREAEASGFCLLHKPVDPDELAEKIMEAIRDQT